MADYELNTEYDLAAINASERDRNPGHEDFKTVLEALTGVSNVCKLLDADDVVRDLVDPRVAELAVAQARHRVVLVEALLRLGGRLDVPRDQAQAERLGDLVGEHGLAGARLALDQERSLQRDGGVDRDLQIVGGDIILGTSKFHRIALVDCLGLKEALFLTI